MYYITDVMTYIIIIWLFSRDLINNRLPSWAQTCWYTYLYECNIIKRLILIGIDINKYFYNKTKNVFIWSISYWRLIY